MLKGIPPVLGPDLLHILRAMGHGDEIAIVDANYPAEAAGPEVVRLDGHTATDILEAILTLMPLDDFVDDAVFGMQVVGEPDKRMPVMEEFDAIVARYEPGMKLKLVERFAFYDRVESAFAIVQTGERRLYGNILLKKGIIRPDA
ncbi:transporter [Youhaiella tibetensis]|uniref:Ribose ABC transporter n=1 Tax=Paradevosia tibetensis TaxID=1447062 RepID=A0A5B9DSC1_9HYPH|nr:RbsD/FucU domain-containing protein [Youhaiella tibetensis]QEE22046.1 ribose ABC transporter [Youhaiella tibetensis]GGF45838.1 transporter [Youhaiella tibetensis]